VQLEEGDISILNAKVKGRNPLTGLNLVQPLLHHHLQTPFLFCRNPLTGLNLVQLEAGGDHPLLQEGSCRNPLTGLNLVQRVVYVRRDVVNKWLSQSPYGAKPRATIVYIHRSIIKQWLVAIPLRG